MWKNKGLKSSQLLLVLIISSLLVKFFGLLREIVLAYFYGTSIYTDAYVIANNIPTTLFAALGTSIATTFVPMYTRIETETGKGKADSFTRAFLFRLFMICLVASIIGIIFTEQFVWLFASGFKGETLDLTIQYTRILFPSIVGMLLMNLFGAYLQCNGKIVPIAIVPMISNITIIVALFISYYLQNVYLFVWGTLIGVLLQVLFYLPWVVKSGLFSSQIYAGCSDEDTKKYLRIITALIIPVFLGEAVNEINSIIDKTLVSGLGEGVVSSLNYGYKIINMLHGVFIASLMTLIYPQLAKMAAEKDKSKFSASCKKGCAGIFAIMGLVTAMIIFAGETLVQLVLGHGSFDSDSVKMTAMSLVCYGVGLVGMGEREIIGKAMYSMQDTKTPMINGVYCALMNIILDLILIHFWGYTGAALATSIVATLGAINLYRSAVKKKYIDAKGLFESICKSSLGLCAVGLFMFMSNKLVLNGFAYSRVLLVGQVIVCLLSIMVFLVSQILFKNNYVIDIFKSFVGGRRKK